MRKGTTLGAAGVAALAAALAGRAAAADEPILRVTVEEAGIYVVPGDAVSAAGLETRACDLHGAGGAPVPIVERADGSFEFWGDPFPARHSKDRSYVLRARRAGAAATRAEAVALPERIAIERNDYYDPVEANERAVLAPFVDPGIDFFYFGAPKGDQRHAIALPALAGEEPVRVVLRLQGERRTTASNGIDVWWNGARVGGTIRWTGPAPHEAAVEVPREALKAGENELRLQARDGRVRLDRVTVEAAPRERPKARKPARIEAARLPNLAAGGADYVAIAAESLAPELAPLLAHREAQGLKTRLVTVQQVFDAYSGGTLDPRALRAFLKEAAEKWSPKPRFVLLAGEAMHDVGWHLPRGETVPAALVDTHDNGATASDDWFVAWGEDGATPELAIGRFPVRTKEECRAAVARTIAYEKSAERGPWRRRISFLAGEGRFGEAVDAAIEGLATSIINEYVPQSFDVNMTYASATSPYLYVPSRLTEKVIDRMNEGAAIISYTGHGQRKGFDDLHYKGKRFPIFHAKDVAKVKCSARPPIVFITACWTGCYDYPEEEAVGEVLFESATGPVAVFAATRVSHPFANAILSKDLVAGLFRAIEGTGAAGGDGATEARAPGGPRRLGEAIVEMKRRSVGAKDRYREMIDGYGVMFLGDPVLLKRLVLENMHLYNLLGDPALVPAFPAGRIPLECGEAAAGKKLEVKGKVDGLESGEVVVTLEIPRVKMKRPIEPVDLDAKDAEKKVAKNYELANDKVLARVEAKVQGGAFRAEIAVPADVEAGKCFVKAYAWNGSADAAGAAEVAVAGKGGEKAAKAGGSF